MEFIGILNQACLGLLSNEGIEVLKRCRAPLESKNGIEPTQLYSRNKGVRFFLFSLNIIYCI